ncbi:hypothetical protein AVEN_210787-1 [Araneus ventricosus]|uniref:Uncharacterized protein n=1 Tax=Araneus ventricosus TaxID=182803 RepID=A0A4Y2CL39_ARAVE|nr:hypothetical protein AVEN_210787-1 [Araneus ventricosus]
MFYNIFDTIPERPVGNTDNLYFVFDGGCRIHRVVWPKQEPFGDVYTTYMFYIKRHYGDELTVVFDGYTESSVNTKNSQGQFLSNLAKRSVSFRKPASHLENVCICTFVATDDADVHIVNTGIETYEKIKKQVVVIGQDVDILVLLIALTPDYIDILILKEGDFRSLVSALWFLPVGLAFSQLFKNLFTITLRLTLLFKRQSIFSLITFLQDVHSSIRFKKCLHRRSQLLAGMIICYILPGVSLWYSTLLCSSGWEKVLKYHLEEIFFGWSSENKWTNCAMYILLDHFIANQEFIQSGLIVVLCWYLFGLLKRIVISFANKAEEVHDLESIFLSYLKFSKTICKCISLLEQAMSLLLLLLYGFMIFSIFNVTTFLMTANLSKVPISLMINQMTVFLVMLTGFYFLSFQAIAVHDAAVKVKYSVYHNVSTSSPVNSRIKYLLLTMVTEFPSTVVVTCWGLFSLKRNFLKRTTSGIFTYAMILAQIGNGTSLN